MSFWGSTAEVLTALKNLNEEFVAMRVDFAHLSESTDKTIDGFRRVVEKIDGDMRTMEKEHVRERAELHAKIDVLSERLNTVAGAAMLEAVQEEARRRVDQGAGIFDITIEDDVSKIDHVPSPARKKPKTKVRKKTKKK